MPSCEPETAAVPTGLFTTPFTSPALILGVLALLMLLVPLLAVRLRIPAIVGLLFAGMVFGANGYHLVERVGMVAQLGQAGLLFIVFLAGLEIDLNRFQRLRGHSLKFGFISYLVPQVLGAFMALTILGFNWPTSILLASMFGSHTLLTYPMASRLGIARNNAVTATVGGTIVTDTSALLVLTVIASSVEGELGWAFWLRLGIGLAAYSWLVFWALPRLGRWFFRTIRSEEATDFMFVVAALFLFAFLSQVAGLQPITGAFFSGLALNRLIPDNGALMNRLKFFGNAMLIPIFLLSVGMLVDVRVLLGGGDTWKVIAAMVVTVTATKFLAAHAAGWWLKYTFDERMTVFGMSVNQAAATLAAVLVGYQIGLFGDMILNGTIVMILVTCMIGPWVTERWGRRVAASDELKPVSVADAPRRILIPLSNPHSAPALMDLAFLVHDPKDREPIHPITVVPDGPDATARVAQSEKLLGVAVARGASASVPVSPVMRVDMNIAEGIRRALLELRISMVIIGWSGEVPVARRIFGSVLDQLLDSSTQAIIVSRLVAPLNTTRRVIVVLPRFSIREAGFGEVFGGMKTIAQQLGAELFVYTRREEIATTRELIPRIAPTDLPFEVEAFPSLPRLMPHLATQLHEDDLLVLFSVREKRLTWTPMLDRLPKIIADAHPHVNLLITYLPEESEDVGSLMAMGVGPGAPSVDGVGTVRVLMNMSGGDAGEVLLHLVDQAMDQVDSATQARVTDALQRNVSDALELLPGIALIHAHVDGLPERRLLVGISPEGVHFEGLEEPVVVLFALASPGDLPPQEHLRFLGRIAHLMRDEALVEQLREVTDADATLRLLAPLQDTT